MSWTKRQIIAQAYSEIGFADYAFDMQPEQLQNALRILDSMVAEWDGNSIFLRYPMTSEPSQSSLDTDSNIPDKYIATVYNNLALRIAPGLGRQPLASTITAAKAGLNIITRGQVTALSRVADPGAAPVGVGNSPTGRSYIIGE
jgi:hypothetical protein